MPKLGILFDIDELESTYRMTYGYAAFRIFFDAIDTHQIAGCILSHGDTNETLIGRANQYCIAVESLDESKIATVKNALSACDARGLLPLASRFLDDAHVRDEPLVYAGNIDAAGQLVNVTSYDIGSVTQAWKESREKHQASSPTVAEPPSATERLVHAILLSERPIPKSGPDVIGCLALAFPEQFEIIDPVTGEFRLRDEPKGAHAYTYREALEPDAADQLKSWLQRTGKGVHDLPRKHDIDVSEDIKRGHGLFPVLMSSLLEKINPAFATSLDYRRKWSVIDGGGFGKILAIGVYTTTPQVSAPPPPLTPQPEAPKSPEAPCAKKYCIYCGFEMRVEGIYCPKCGKRQVEVVK